LIEFEFGEAMIHCSERSSEIIVGEKSHFNMWEQGGIGQVICGYFAAFNFDQIVQ